MTERSEETRREWLNVARELDQDVNAKILCPDCHQDFLQVIRVPFEHKGDKEKGVQRYEDTVFCENCGAKEFIFYRVDPLN
jgi:Zn finger protein HypA/HybF involved in hydrogenase expression